MSLKRWHEDLEVRKRLRNKLEKQKSAQLQQEVLSHEDKWKQLKSGVEEQKKEKLRLAVKEAEEKKRNQERLLRGKREEDTRALEQERLVSVEREQRAKMNKALQELKERRRLQEENRQELLRHVLTKQRIEQREEEVEAQKRREMQRKMKNSSRKYAYIVEARLRELRERVAQEEEQIHRAKLRAELQSAEQLMHKRVLYDLSQGRMEKAAQHASDVNKTKLTQVRQRNSQREKCHRQLRERLEAEEAALRKARECHVTMKEQRRERLQRQRALILEEAHRLARASFHLRDRVRQHTSSNTFDQMVKEAELNAAMTHFKLAQH